MWVRPSVRRWGFDRQAAEMGDRGGKGWKSTQRRRVNGRGRLPHAGGHKG
jgi:hypothetical protein